MDIKLIKLFYKYASGGDVIDILTTINQLHNNPSIAKIIAYANRYLNMDDDLKDVGNLNAADPVVRQQHLENANVQVPIFKDFVEMIKALHAEGKSNEDIGSIVLNTLNVTGLTNVIKFTNGAEFNLENINADIAYALGENDLRGKNKA